jgi:hypothetical protein
MVECLLVEASLNISAVSRHRLAAVRLPMAPSLPAGGPSFFLGLADRATIWIRDYTDSDTHPQMLKVGNYGREIFRFLCRISGRYDLEGEIPEEYLNPVWLLGQLGLKCCDGCPVPAVTHVTDGVTSLIVSGLLVRNEAGVTKIDGWARKQPRAPKSNAERQRVFRSRSVTVRNEKVTRRNALEKSRVEKSRVESKDSVEPAPPPVDLAHQVFDYWRDKLHPAATVFDKDTRKKVQERIDEGFTVEQLRTAVDGCKSNPHNQGVNDRGKRYDALELICRTGANVNRFIGYLSPVPIVKPKDGHWTAESQKLNRPPPGEVKGF